VRTTSGVHVNVWGDGPAAVFAHGSFGWGEETWREQRPLADRYRLLVVDRRGFGRSPADGRVDFDRDADDLEELLGDGAHLVGHSYGGIGCLLAAARRPERVRSLTLIEPPAFGVVRGHPAVEDVIANVAEAVRTAADPAEYRLRFLQSFGFPTERVVLDGVALEAARASWHERPPQDADIPLDRLARAGVRVLLVHGDWCPAPQTARALAGTAFRAVCDVLHERLDAERAVLPAAHNPQRLGRVFNEMLATFWEHA
jgi:pimeloyl-ACP methyl ester carboxylesterase